MTESLVFEHEGKKKTLLGKFVLTGAGSYRIIKIDRSADQGAIRRNRPDLRRRFLTLLHPVHDVGVMNKEPEKSPFGRFIREPIDVVTWDYRRKSAARFQPMNRPLRSKVPPTP